MTSSRNVACKFGTANNVYLDNLPSLRYKFELTIFCTVIKKIHNLRIFLRLIDAV